MNILKKFFKKVEIIYKIENYKKYKMSNYVFVCQK